MLYYKYSVDMIMVFTCIISVLMITHHHHLVVMCYVWFSFSVLFLFLLCCQYCAWTELLLVLPVSCLETAFFYKSSPLACHLSCFGVSNLALFRNWKQACRSGACACVCGEAASHQILREHSSVIKELSINGKPFVHEILKICVYGVVLAKWTVRCVGFLEMEKSLFDRKMFLAY